MVCSLGRNVCGEEMHRGRGGCLSEFTNQSWLGSAVGVASANLVANRDLWEKKKVFTGQEVLYPNQLVPCRYFDWNERKWLLKEQP